MGETTSSDDPTRLSEFRLKSDYRKARKNFANEVLRALRVSRGAAGIRSETAQHYWASVLFTRLVVTAKSIQVLAPELEPDAHWDFSAVASITRNLAECYLFFYFLCADDAPQVEMDARIILLDLHDNASRQKLIAELGEPDNDVETAAAMAKVVDDLVSKFNANAYLSGLPEKRQKELIRGEKTPFVQDEVIERAKLDKKTFRFWYRFFSNHTHSGPLAFYRMAEHGRGCGIQNYQDTFYTACALSFACDFLRQATADFVALFPNAETRGTAVVASEEKAGATTGRKLRRTKRR